MRIAIAFLWVLFLGAMYCGPSQAREIQAGLWQIDQAQFAAVDSRQPPASAAWKDVQLPDHWRITAPGFKGVGWYRVRFDLAETPREPYAVFLPARRGFTLDTFVNGSVIGTQRQTGAHDGGPRLTAVYLTVPPALLKAGANAIEFRMAGDARAWAGLGRVSLGEARLVRGLYNARYLLQSEITFSFLVTLGFAGVFGLALWIARRSDSASLWFAIGALAWSAVALARYATRDLDIGNLREVMFQAMWYLGSFFTVVVCLRAEERRWPVFESLMWASYVLFAGTLWLEGSRSDVFRTMTLVLDPVYTTLPVVIAGWLLVQRRNRLAGATLFLSVAVLLAVALPVHDWLRDAAILDLDRPTLRMFQPMVMMAGVFALVVERYLQGTRQIERMNLVLEERVAEKAREIEANHERVEEARREHALSRERQRILEDVHDGLGASLIGLQRHVQAGSFDRASIERRVEDALREMRIAIEALQPRGGDLAAVLGGLRYQLEGMLRETGLRLVWEVDELPLIEALNPAFVFSMQRILLEAIGNALKHSGATQVRLIAKARDDGSIEIRIEDNGCGFDGSLPVPGVGLATMRARASRIGARLELRARPGEGTTLQLSLPRTVAPPEPPADLSPATSVA